jgi:hypothetical protein
MSKGQRLIRETVAPNGLEFWRQDPSLTPPPIEQRREYWCEIRCPTCKVVLVGGPCGQLSNLWSMWSREKVRHVTEHPAPNRGEE